MPPFSTATGTDVRGRFCPSPTGTPHVGMVCTALFNWAYARHTGGTMIFGKDRGLTAQQRKVSIDGNREGVASGEIVEMFARGTAAVVTAFAALKADGRTVGDEDAAAREFTMSLRQERTDIQYGRKAG